MKMIQFTTNDFSSLTSLDKIEYLLRKEIVIKNIKKSMPVFEVIFSFCILAYSRLHTLLILSAFGIDNSTISLVNQFSMFFNTLIVILTISFIARSTIYFRKHRQLNDLYEEFLDRLKLYSYKGKVNKKNI